MYFYMGMPYWIDVALASSAVEIYLDTYVLRLYVVVPCKLLMKLKVDMSYNIYVCVIIYRVMHDLKAQYQRFCFP